MSGLVGSASSIPHPSPLDRGEAIAADGHDDELRGGDAEPTRPAMSSELALAIAKAHRGWAAKYAPHLLEEWLNT